MGFVWHWFTKVGSMRQDNQDFAGIAQWGDSLFAVIADGVSSYPDSGSLARDLTRALVDMIFAKADPPTSDELADYVREAFNQLKYPGSPAASAAFLVACFAADRLMYAVHAGDCRIGLQSRDGHIAWKTDVHCLANAIVPLSEENLRSHPLRNQLTRSFRTKRYCIPDVAVLTCEYVGGAILATDGFWAELPIEDQPLGCSQNWNGPQNNEDDVSRLVIRWGRFLQAPAEESSRLYVRRR